MKKLYQSFLFIFVLGMLALSAFPSKSQAQSTTGVAYVGYAQYSDQIWEYDGLSLQFDSKVGCAIKLTAEQLRPYIGGTITGIRVGWDTTGSNGSYECFVREDFNSEDLTAGRGTARFGWNNIKVDAYEISEDVDQLVVGFTTTVMKNICCIPTLYPHNVKNSCYLWVEGDFDDNGDPLWVDSNESGILPILLMVKDSKGTFNFVPVIQSMTDNGVVSTAQPSDCLLKIRNLGSQSISSMEFTSRQGENVYSRRVSLTKSIGPSAISGFFLAPLQCFETGPVEFSITKCNNKEIANPTVYTVDLIGVPDEVSQQYKRRPLIEYYESENSYMSPRYYDEEGMLSSSLRKVNGQVTFVCQHMDDQFMTGDDDATSLALWLCDNDSSSVSIPAVTVDRAMATDNILYQQGSALNAMFSVLYEPYGSEAFKAALSHPTFASVEVSGVLAPDMEALTVNVGGDIAMQCLPKDEKPYVTVYLMERDVFSDSQLFWTDKDKDEHMGEYTHPCVIREILTAPEGDPLETDGTVSAQYSTYLAPDWNLDNLYLVAFLHRDGQLGGRRMHVFNSAEGEITLETGIAAPSAIRQPSGLGITDLSGRRLRTIGTQRGIFIVNGKKIVR